MTNVTFVVFYCLQAVLTRSLTDVLSHVAIRARSQHALLATCFDAADWASLAALDGKHVRVSVAADIIGC